MVGIVFTSLQFLLVLVISLIPEVHLQFSPGQILTSESTYCKNSLYNWPKCIDSPKGYSCSCGAGFYWNTKSCISEAVDSRLEFPAPVIRSNSTKATQEKAAFAYTLLLSKPCPLLEHFTLSLYLNPDKAHLNRRQCVLSYRYYVSDRTYIFSVFIGAKLELTIFNQTATANITDRLTGKGWSHLIITWTSETGEAVAYLNRTKLGLRDETQRSAILSTGHVIESGGLLVLGQYSPQHHTYNLNLGYIGSLAHVNIWLYVFDKRSIETLFDDCTFTHCGDGVEWVDLRQGTRGTSRLVWPSGIDSPDNYCFKREKALFTCDKYCSHVIGVQCKEETQESIIWNRMPAATPDNSTAVLILPCPGYPPNYNTTKIPTANRSCVSSEDKVGVWGTPQVDNCLSDFFKSFINKVRSYMSGQNFDKAYVIQLLTLLRNHTHTWIYNNPVDLSITIDSLSKLLRFQEEKINTLLSDKGAAYVTGFTDSSRSDLTYGDTITISDLHLGIIDELINERNDEAWRKTIPRGQEADELLQLIEKLSSVISLSLKYHILTGEVTDSFYRKSLTNLAMKIEVMRKKNFVGVVFPDVSDILGLEMSEDPGLVTYVPPDKFQIRNQRQSDDYIASVVLRMDTFSKLLYDPRYGKGKEDQINSPVISVHLLPLDNSPAIPENSTKVKMRLSFFDTKNISNPECAAIVHGNNSANLVWNRDPSVCKVLTNDSNKVECECSGEGFFTATTDMYNVNWIIPEPPPELLTLPSYLGCSLAIILSLCTFSMLVYVGAASRTAVMHKHFSIAVMGNTSTFLIGITLTSNENVCKGFAIMFHYFFLSMFSWLMNEAFNLYISITYTAHNQSTQEHTDHWKYYIIGWGIPGVIVAAIVGTKYDSYLAEDMCWTAWSNIWFFFGPPLAMISISLLVMTFAAKENNEVSYTKNESANKITEYHSNAVWTQLILTSCTWAFGFLSLRFSTQVFKWVFFMFHSAQGAFLFVFFFLLNEEVRSVFKTKEINTQLGLDQPGQRSSTDNLLQEDQIPLNPATGNGVNSLDQRSTTTLTRNPHIYSNRSALSDCPQITITPDKVKVELDNLSETRV